MTLVIAHRGASRARQENTIAAFRAAGEMGADGVELDVRRTADDRLVVHHDATVADGRIIRVTTFDDLPGEMPTLATALDACHGMFVNIEIKNEPSEPDFDPTDWVAHRTCVELIRRGVGPRWLISSFRRETVDLCRTLVPACRTAWLTTAPTADELRSVAQSGHDAVHPWVDRLDAATIRAAHGQGLAVNAWTCDDPERIAELISWGVDGICTNVPDVALAVRSGVGATGRPAGQRPARG